MTGRDDTDLDAAEYVLGLLGPQEVRALEVRLADDGDLTAAACAWQDRTLPLAEAAPLAPREHVRDAVLAAIDGEPQPGSVTIRADEGRWVELFPGVARKHLLHDPATGTQSFLLRFAPGGVCPSHSHGAVEECLVLEGDMIIGRARFGPGDYQAVPAGVPHLPITSRTGALVFIRTAA